MGGDYLNVEHANVQLAHCGSPPVRLVLGSHAVDTMRDKLRHSVEEIESWLSVSTLKDGKTDPM